MVDMADKEIIPAVCAYVKSLADEVGAKTAAVPGLGCKYEKGVITELSELTDEISAASAELKDACAKYESIEDVTEASCFIRDVMLGKMDALRAPCDKAETLTAEKYWPFPTYGDLLFGVK